MSAIYWPWWLGGLALAGIVLAHWMLLRRMMAVSGRYTAIVDRWRARREESAGAPVEEELSPEEMIEAVRALAIAEFGAEAVTAPAAPSPALPTALGPQRFPLHFIFLGALVFGGAIGAVFEGPVSLTLTLRSVELGNLVGANPAAQALTLLLGGVLVGFGTRMAGGCTSGHGLCGVSRFQPGSFVATASFFAAGVAVSFVLEVLR